MRKLLLAIALLLAAVSLRAGSLLPTSEGTTWQYDSAETGTGPAPVQSVVIVRAGKELLDGKEVVKLETLSGGVITKTELVSIDEKGIVCLARSGKDGKITKLNPPAPIIVAPLKVGAAWEFEGEAAGITTHQHCTVLPEETVTVAAGKFRASHLQCKDTSLMSITLDRWFVPGTGFVKESTVVRGPGLLQRTTLELTKITQGPAKPAVTPSPAAPKASAPPPVSSPKPSPVASPSAMPATPTATPEEKTAAPVKKLTVEVSNDPAGGLKTEFKSDITNIYVRWHGHELSEGATVRVAWVAEDVGDLVEPNFVIDETEMVVPSPDASARFTLGRPPDGWAEGKYRVDFYVDDILTETVKVTISK
jgi:hypothetical protein